MPAKKKLVEKEYDTQLSILGDGKDIYIKIAWNPGDTQQIADFLLSIASGSAFGLFMQYAEQYAKSIDDEESFADMTAYLSESLMNQKEQMEEPNELVVEPINAIGHLASMHQGVQE